MENKSENIKNDFLTLWTQKKKAGFGNYIAVGFLSCIAFFFFAEAIASFILGRNKVVLLEMIIFIILSAILPVALWYYNESKFKKLGGEAAAAAMAGGPAEASVETEKPADPQETDQN